MSVSVGEVALEGSSSVASGTTPTTPRPLFID